MAKENVEKFFALLKDDQQALERLRPVVDPDEFDRLAAELGHERGLEFTPAEFRAAISEALNREPAELADEELQGVAGGIGVMKDTYRLETLGCQSGWCNRPGLGSSAGCVMASAACLGGGVILTRQS